MQQPARYRLVQKVTDLLPARLGGTRAGQQVELWYCLQQQVTDTVNSSQKTAESTSNLASNLRYKAALPAKFSSAGRAGGNRSCGLESGAAAEAFPSCEQAKQAQTSRGSAELSWPLCCPCRGPTMKPL